MGVHEHLVAVVMVGALFVAADAEAAESATGSGTGEQNGRAVLLGGDGGLAAFVGGSRSRVGAERGTLLGVYAGYRFSGGIEPELSYSQLDFSSVADSHPQIQGLAPGCRWWIPFQGPIRPWVGTHLGMDQVQSQSSDVTDVRTYWRIEAGGGIDFMLMRHLSLGMSMTLAYADVLNRPAEPPTPPGYAAMPAPSYALTWITMQAGATITL